jgi:hypothetical protein
MFSQLCFLEVFVMNSRYRLLFLSSLVLCIIAGASVSQAQTNKRAVSFEEFTGSWCGYCPYGAWNLDSIQNRMGRRAVIVSFHEGDDMAIKAQDTINPYVHVGGYPNTSVDRRYATGSPAGWYPSMDWYTNAVSDAAKSPAVDFRVVNAIYNSSTRKLECDIDITPYNLATLPTEDTVTYATVAVATEDGFVESQSLYDPSGTTLPDISDYVNYNVARAVGGKVLGDPFTMGTKTTITYPIRKHYKFTLDPSWSEAGIRVKAFVVIKSKGSKWQDATLNADQTMVYADSLPTIPNQAVWVVLPHTGDNLDPTTTHSIIWGAGGGTTAVKLEYSIDAGATWKSIVASTAVSPYVWTVDSSAYGKSVKIRISDASTSSVTSISDGFRVLSPVIPTITITAPGTGEVLATGSVYAVNFSTSGPVAESKTLSLSLDSGKTWSTLSSGTFSSFSYNWTVPAANTNTAFLKLADGNNVVGMSGMFSIKPSVGQISDVAITGAPNVPDSTMETISWTISGTFSEQLTLSWSSDNVHWTPIASGISTSAKNYSWTTPSGNYPKAWVQVSVPSGIVGVSAQFAIQSASGVASTQVAGELILQSYPNPSSGISTFSYVLPEQTVVSMTISDVLGREVKSLAGGTQSAGSHSLSMDLRSLPNGTYNYSLHAGSKVATGSLILSR